MPVSRDAEQYDDEEAARRRDAVIKRMLDTPPRPRQPKPRTAEPKESSPRPERPHPA
jgi:hypothetical protein